MGITCSLREVTLISLECAGWNALLSKRFCTSVSLKPSSGSQTPCSKRLTLWTDESQPCHHSKTIQSQGGAKKLSWENSSGQLSLRLPAKYPRCVWAVRHQISSCSTSAYLRRGDTAITFCHNLQLHARLLHSLTSWARGYPDDVASLWPSLVFFPTTVVRILLTLNGLESLPNVHPSSTWLSWRNSL